MGWLLGLLSHPPVLPNQVPESAEKETSVFVSSSLQGPVMKSLALSNMDEEMDAQRD